jgi:hypothetical protein
MSSFVAITHNPHAADHTFARGLMPVVVMLHAGHSELMCDDHVEVMYDDHAELMSDDHAELICYDHAELMCDDHAEFKSDAP